MSHLREAAETLLYRYASVIDDGDLADWPGFFAEDAEYKLIPRENFLRGMQASLMWCKNRAMMRDRVIAIKKASVYTPHYYRHLYTNILVERTDLQVTLRANYLVCRTQDDGDTTIFSAGRVVAGLSIPDELSLGAPSAPSSGAPRSDPFLSDVPPLLDSNPPSMAAPRTVRVGFSPGPSSIPAPPSMMAPLSLAPRSLAPRSFAPRSLSSAPPSMIPGSTFDPTLTLPPPSRRRPHPSPIFLSMTVIYDTCRIPGLLVFPI